MCVCRTEYVHMCPCVYARVYWNATSKTYPLSRVPAFLGINKANVRVCVEPQNMFDRRKSDRGKGWTAG